MLRQMVRAIFARKPAGGESQPAAEDEVQKRKRWGEAHARSPLKQHLDIVLGDLRIGDHGVLALSDSCLTDTDSRIPPLKAFRRPLASYFLARYFLHAMELGGQFAECGVYSGISALFVCRAARTRRPDYAGEGLHLIDSFEGLSQPGNEDFFTTRAGDGSVARKSIPQGSYASPMDVARHTMREFPSASIHKGWIPAVFQGLPETRWAFVHLDVDLYEPTLASLEYFYPLLCEGGVIVCDDYGAPLFPGAQRAWDRFCYSQDVPFIVLDTGQSVILKT
jgi:O-methyltransferase